MPEKTDKEWIDLFRAGGPQRAPKEPGLPSWQPKPYRTGAYRQWRATGAPTSGSRALIEGRPVREGFYRLEFKTHSRHPASPGSSVLARIAYRTAERLGVRDPDEPGRDGPDPAAGPAAAHAAYQTGTIVDIADFSRRRGVADWYTLIPEGAPAWMAEPERLGDVWAAVAAREDQSTRRATATEAREAILALPVDLYVFSGGALVHDFARHLVDRYGVVATVAIHAPSRDGDRRNWHAHIMYSDRRCGPEGFGEKAREMNVATGGRAETRYLRSVWASMLNEAYERRGLDRRVDHRSYEAREAEARARGDTREADRWVREPTEHMGPAITQAERAHAQQRRSVVARRAGGSVIARGASRAAELIGVRDPDEPEPGPVTEIGRENHRRRAASLEREAAYQTAVNLTITMERLARERAAKEKAQEKAAQEQAKELARERAKEKAQEKARDLAAQEQAKERAAQEQAKELVRLRGIEERAIERAARDPDCDSDRGRERPLPGEPDWW